MKKNNADALMEIVTTFEKLVFILHELHSYITLYFQCITTKSCSL